MENKKELITESKLKITFTPNTVGEAMILAEMISKSDLAPSTFKNKKENCFIAMQMGAEVGLSPMQAIQNIAVINNRPTIWGDAMLALVQNHPAYEWHNEKKDDNGEWAETTIKRKGHMAYTSRFTKEDAKKAGLLNKSGTWQSYPLRMLQLRARSWALRDKFSDALKGLQCAEEIGDYVETTATKIESETEAMPKMLDEKINTPKIETKVDSCVIFIVKVTKIKNNATNSFSAEIIDKDGVVYGSDVEVGKKAKTFEGKEAVIFYEGRTGKPWITDVRDVLNG